MLRIIQSCNITKFQIGTLPLWFKSEKIGYCLPEVVEMLKREKDLPLEILSDKIILQDIRLLNQLLDKWRNDEAFLCLKGWRNELYPIYSRQKFLGTIERSGSGLFGLRTYGVHINGYMVEDGCIKMWVAKRSKNKQTWPGFMDQVAAGGIPSGQKIKDAVLRECEEEASIPQSLAERATSVGLISYFLLGDLGYCPETQYCYDLELPISFNPRPNDGEVEEFMLLPIEKVQDLILTDQFKPNCALVVIDFLIRHGIVTPDSDQDYVEIVESLRRNLSSDLAPPLPNKS
eukprot:NODE_213_length_12556_cov_0.937063.p6 type:complete len:289 gc:universal NODE_213_length_12556_cov_0.937063:12183-11317(-)